MKLYFSKFQYVDLFKNNLINTVNKIEFEDFDRLLEKEKKTLLV